MLLIAIREDQSMTLTWTQTLGGVATAIALAGYVPYFRDLHRGATKSHAFSWLVWAVLIGIAFAGQVADQALRCATAYL